MAKQSKSTKVSAAQRDEALFQTLGKKKKKRKRKIIITVVSVVVVLAVAAIVGVNFLKRQVREQFASASGEVLSYAVSTGSISTVVSGSGSLTDVDLNTVAVPDGVEITQVKVKTNQEVAAGDLLATVDMSSVVSAMADLQSQLETLDKQISNAEGDAANTSIQAGVSGRVKAVFGEADASVTDVMYEYGALALISLDGYMAVDMETDALTAGDSVTVVLSDEEEIDGTVETVVDGIATVLVSDEAAGYDEAVTVLDGEGTQIGTGNLRIHSPLRVTGYAGTIAEVHGAVNDEVTDDTLLFTLEDTGYSANYNALLRQRSELEEILLQLLTIQRDGAVLAPVDGSVYSVDYTSGSTSVVTLSRDEKMSVTISVDESDILSLELGQTVTVSVSSVSEDAFEGTLTEINRTSSSSGTYSAVIEVEKVEGMLSGMTAGVSVRIEGVDNAILIPVEALHKTSDGAYVYTTYDEELQEYGGKVDVVTGLENSTYVEIKSGLSVGDTVYYTEQQSAFGNFGGMGSFPGGMDFGNMDFGDMDFSSMPGGGQMPDFSGGGFPGGMGGFGGFGG